MYIDTRYVCNIMSPCVICQSIFNHSTDWKMGFGAPRLHSWEGQRNGSRTFFCWKFNSEQFSFEGFDISGIFTRLRSRRVVLCLVMVYIHSCWRIFCIVHLPVLTTKHFPGALFVRLVLWCFVANKYVDLCSIRISCFHIFFVVVRA